MTLQLSEHPPPYNTTVIVIFKVVTPKKSYFSTDQVTSEFDINSGSR